MTKDTKAPINTGEPQPAQLTERTLQQSNPFQREQLVQQPLESTQVHQPQSVSEVMQAAEQHEADLQRQAEEQRLREERQAEEAELRARAEHASAREHREDLEHGTELARNAFQTAIQKAETLLGRHDLPEEAKSLLDYLGQIIQSMRERLTGLEAGMTGWRHEVLTRIETARAAMESQPELSDRARTADNIRAEYELLGRRSSMLEAVYQRHTQNLQLLMLPFEETKPEGFNLEKLMVFFRKAEISDMTEPMETSVSNFPEKLEDELVRAGTLTAILTTPGTGEELRDPRKTLPHLRETINGVTHGWIMSGKIKDLGSDFDIVKLPAFMLSDEEKSPAIMELFQRYQICHGGNEYLLAGVRFQESYDTQYDEAMAAYHEARDTYRSLRDRYNAQQERLRLEEEERQRRFLERRAREQQGLPPLPEPEPTEEQVEEAFIDESAVVEAREASAKAATLASNMRRQKNILSDPTKKYLKDGNDMAQTLGSGMTLVFAKAQEEYDALTSEDEKKAYRLKSFEDLVRLSEQIGRVTGMYTRLVFPDRERTEEEERRLTPLYNRAMDRFKLRAAERMQELAHPETIQQSQEEGQKQSLVVIMQSTMQQIINDAEHTVQYILSERDSEDASVAYERMTDVYHDLDWH
ncbi:MAG: hypothetical protein IJT34_07765, partial [Butyrivibrio sp.]|nr:hypothetical protein [Butyrivibrio sp.]